jgi:HemY protein
VYRDRAAGRLLALNPGQVTIEFLGINAQLPFVLAAGALILATFLLVVLWWVIAKVWGAPDAFRNFRKRQRREQGFDALERALIASAAGQGALAVRQASRAEAMLDRPALSRLLTARAAEAAGDLDSAQVHYEAMLEDAKTRLVARRGLASIAETAAMISPR